MLDIDNYPLAQAEAGVLKGYLLTTPLCHVQKQRKNPLVAPGGALRALNTRIGYW